MVKGNKTSVSVSNLGSKRIEWTGAGGDYFLAVVVEGDEVIAEYWGTRKDVVAWMEKHWPQLPEKFVPMVYSPRRRHVGRSPLGRKKF